MRGAILIWVISALTTASCATAPAVEVRSVGEARVNAGVAQAEGQLVIGNVALALEGFRNRLRDDSRDLRALMGMAVCYDRMGRFDLSRRWYEAALAIAPTNAEVLNQMADSLVLQGRSVDAAKVRAEAAASAAPLATATAVDAVMPHDGQVQLALAESSVTVRLPPPRPVVEPGQAPANRSGHGPRLERLTLGEVALITTDAPVWKAELIHEEPASISFRFVTQDSGPRLLNAARTEGLAARTRDQLAKHGWRDIAIGDAPVVREKTVVLYPPSLRAGAARLAAQLGFGRLQPSIAGRITVLLGRDASEISSRRRTA